MTIAVAQFSPTDDKEENLRLIRTFAAQARACGASLLALPEYTSFTAPRLDRRIVENAEPIDGPFVAAVGEVAKRSELAIVVGTNEEVPGEDRIHNTIVFLDACGDAVGVYRKIHLYDAFGARESEWILPGELVDPSTIMVEGIAVAAQTCYDLRFPEVTRRLAEVGADLVLVPAQWVPGPLKEEHWTILLRARAIENTMYVAGAGQSAPHGAGHSMVVDPMGVTLTSLGEQVGLATAVVTRDRIEEVRARNPSLAARRFTVAPRLAPPPFQQADQPIVPPRPQLQAGGPG